MPVRRRLSLPTTPYSSSPWNYRNSIWQLTTLKKPYQYLVRFIRRSSTLRDFLFFFFPSTPLFDCSSVFPSLGKLLGTLADHIWNWILSIHAAALIVSRVYNRTLIGCVKKKKERRKSSFCYLWTNILNSDAILNFLINRNERAILNRKYALYFRLFIILLILDLEYFNQGIKRNIN